VMRSFEDIGIHTTFQAVVTQKIFFTIRVQISREENFYVIIN
jgi:hypothetical protein